tara:strand:+ start:995 stop:1234 length:240 start_codon:yes stop_codon:yes gene_type:complete
MSSSGCELVLYQKGLDPVVMPALADPISDRVVLGGHLEPLAERLGEPLQDWPGESPDRVAELVDGGWIERRQAWIGRGG